MNFFKFHLVLLFVSFSQLLSAQYFEYNVANKMNYSNAKGGFFAGFIASNNSAVYVLQSNFAKSPLETNRRLKIVAYNKETLTEMESVELIGFSSNKAMEEVYRDLNYEKVLVYDEYILVFWKKYIRTDSTTTEEIWAEAFETDLKRVGKVKLIFTNTRQVSGRESDFGPSSTVVLYNSAIETCFVGGESRKENGDLYFSYLALGTDLNAQSTGEWKLPNRATLKETGLSSSYELGKDGNLYMRTTVLRTKEERIDLGPKASPSYLIFGVKNPTTQDTSSLTLDFPLKTITDYSLVTDAENARVFGFFGDLEKDPSGIDKQGVFYASFDSDSIVNTEVKFTYFERSSLNKLFPKSKGGRVRKGDPVKQLTEEELNTRFDIEYVDILADQSVVLFISRKYNYEEITSSSDLNGENRYKSDFYCEKNNVSAIRISPEGKITWTANLERSVTYLGTDIADIKVLKFEGKYYVFYGTEEDTENAGKRRKFEEQYVNKLEYALFNPGSSKPKKMEMVVGADDVDLKDLDILNERTFTIIGTRIYFTKLQRSQKPVWYALNVLCFPSIYYSVVSGNTKYAHGLIGVAELLDGKDSKKRSRRK